MRSHMQQSESVELGSAVQALRASSSRPQQTQTEAAGNLGTNSSPVQTSINPYIAPLPTSSLREHLETPGQPDSRWMPGLEPVMLRGSAGLLLMQP
jgi:hypothetical protein